jgi:hypothetical protein
MKISLVALISLLNFILANGNIFTGIVSFLNKKIATCSNNCVICDEPLGFKGLKPSVCDSVIKINLI